MIFGEMCVKDFFWLIFENTWQPNADDQQKLFSRVAQNFIDLLSFVKHPHYQETFLKVTSFIILYYYYYSHLMVSFLGWPG